MSGGPYVRLSDLESANLTFDADEMPAPVQKKKNIAEPTREEMEVEERRKRGTNKKASRQPKGVRRRQMPPEEEEGGYPFAPGEGPDDPAYQQPPPNGPPGGDIDEALYGPSAPSGNPTHGPPPTPAYPPPGYAHPGHLGVHEQPKPEKKGVEEYLPYLAGFVILGFAIYYLIQRRNSE
jgi:hypothetical protein